MTPTPLTPEEETHFRYCLNLSIGWDKITTARIFSTLDAARAECERLKADNLRLCKIATDALGNPVSIHGDTVFVEGFGGVEIEEYMRDFDNRMSADNAQLRAALAECRDYIRAIDPKWYEAAEPIRNDLVTRIDALLKKG